MNKNNQKLLKKIKKKEKYYSTLKGWILTLCKLNVKFTYFNAVKCTCFEPENPKNEPGSKPCLNPSEPVSKRWKNLGEPALFPCLYLDEPGAFLVICTSEDDISLCEEVLKGVDETVIFGLPEGKFLIMEDGEMYSYDESWLIQCSGCRKYSFMNNCGSYECRICGEYDGDHHIMRAYNGLDKLFKEVKGR